LTFVRKKTKRKVSKKEGRKLVILHSKKGTPLLFLLQRIPNRNKQVDEKCKAEEKNSRMLKEERNDGISISDTLAANCLSSTDKEGGRGGHKCTVRR